MVRLGSVVPGMPTKILAFASLQAIGGSADLSFGRCPRRSAGIARVLEFDHPPGIFGRQRAGLVEQRDLLAGQLELRSREIIDQLFLLLRAEDDARHERAGELPGERDTRHGSAGRVRNAPQRAQHTRQALHIYRRKIERSATRVRWPFLVRIEFARKKTAGERAPRQDRDALRLAQRCDLALDIAAGDRVVDLRALEPRELVLLRKGNRLRCKPRWQVAEPDVTRLTRANDFVERTHGLLDGRYRIETVYLIKIDVVEAEAPQAFVDAGQDVRAR